MINVGVGSHFMILPFIVAKGRLMIETKQEPCAWCPGSDEDNSHGICDEHAEELLIQSSQRQFDRVPSYIERFRDEKRYRDKYAKEAR